MGRQLVLAAGCHAWGLVARPGSWLPDLGIGAVMGRSDARLAARELPLLRIAAEQ